MKTIKELKAELPNLELWHGKDSEEYGLQLSQIEQLKDVLGLINELNNNASNERKTSKDKRYWLGCCQILNELKARIEV